MVYRKVNKNLYLYEAGAYDFQSPVVLRLSNNPGVDIQVNLRVRENILIQNPLIYKSMSFPSLLINSGNYELERIFGYWFLRESS